MPGRISDDAIRTIRERASLVEVVSDVVALRRRGGRSAVGLCPFHAEKTPSFNVSEEHGFFHCFGCGEHGDVFAFVMKTQSLAFPEAVRTVAERFGLPRAGGRRRQRRARASRWSRSTRPPRPSSAARCAARPARAPARYLARARHPSPTTIERFGLGYAPGGGDALVRHLRAQALPIDDARHRRPRHAPRRRAAACSTASATG